MGEFGALFNPGMRHELEERRAKQMMREEEGTGRKGRLGIDLDSGVAIISSGGAGEDVAEPGDGAGDSDPDDVTDSDPDDAADATDAAEAPAVAEASEAAEALGDAPGPDASSDDAADELAAGDTTRGDAAPQRPAHRDVRADRQGDGRADPRPGRPQPAARSAAAVPSGKARRLAGSTPPAVAPAPAGKLHRSG